MIRNHFAPFLRFIGVGVIGTTVHYTVLVAAVEGIGLGAVLGSSLGFLAGACVNYTLARWLVFRTDQSHVEAGLKFLTVAASGLCLNAVAMAGLVETLGVPYLAAQVAVTAALSLWHYGANHLWTFAVRPDLT